jgi:hypothetical protein
MRVIGHRIGVWLAAAALLATACGGSPQAGPHEGAAGIAPEVDVATPSATPAALARPPMPAAPSDGTLRANAGPAVAPAPTATPAMPVATPAPPPTSAPRPTAPAPQPAAPPPLAPPSGGQPVLGGCAMFPADNTWNRDISALPVDADSATYIASIYATGGNGFLHADFGGGGAYGVPFIVVPQSQPPAPINFTDYGDESDPGPYPVPLDAPLEGGGEGDSHVLALQQGSCRLFEMYNAHPRGDHWDASSGAVFDLNSNALRPASWTSADAAGLPILPGLVRYDEVAAGAINHAVRFTAGRVQRAWVAPATHYGTSRDPAMPPYGVKLRLKASFDTSPYHSEARVILEALKRYGMILADQGSSWFITGASDPRWNDEDLNQLKRVPGSAFDVVAHGPLQYP